MWRVRHAFNHQLPNVLTHNTQHAHVHRYGECGGGSCHHTKELPPGGNIIIKSNECDVCHAGPTEGSKLTFCGSCKTVEYCSKKCQRAGWPEHKLECGKLKGLRDMNKNRGPAAYREAKWLEQKSIALPIGTIVTSPDYGHYPLTWGTHFIQGMVLASDIKCPQDDFTRLAYLIKIQKRVYDGKPAPFGAGTNSYRDGTMQTAVTTNVKAVQGAKHEKPKKVLNSFKSLIKATRDQGDKLFEQCGGHSSQLAQHVRDPAPVATIAFDPSGKGILHSQASVQNSATATSSMLDVCTQMSALGLGKEIAPDKSV